MHCSCPRLERPQNSTSNSSLASGSGRNTPVKPYQQIVFESRPNINLEWISPNISLDSSRSRIRSHVMQRYRTQQALNQLNSGPRRPVLFEDSEPRVLYHYKCPECGRLNTECCHETTTDRHAENHIRWLSPHLLPIEQTSESLQLYQYLAEIYVFVQNPVPSTGLGLVSYCLPFIISSAAVLSAVLSLVASHRVLIGKPAGDKSNLVAAHYYHKLQAIHIVNQEVTQRSNTVAYDVQVAIAILAILEYTTGAIDTARQHINGLREIMTANGGSVTAPSDNKLSLKIVDLANLLSNEDKDGTSINQYRILDDALKSLPQDSHPSIRSMFHSLLRLSSTMPRRHNGNINEQSAWLNELNLTEFKMHTILENELISGHSSPEFVSWRAYPITGTIFLCMWLRQLSIRSNVIDYLVDSLVYTLEETGLENTYPLRILLWLLFVGGSAAEGRRSRRWFLVHTSRSLHSLKVDSWESVKNALLVFPYVEECGEPFRRLWDEIEKSEIDSMDEA